ncbi:MurR/RpiR family transcriptional regulator [Paeniglutamicibacter cryotolerans]|uniref:DNA-binding MurR/RpiR family transcriptional regulator n=1 Tax=Paeniglutamicibacter cryotolerans TaxID=670079 RepID=A0A839QHU2_9MICC|nr:MurR/RpiR family transcriptional regulator [Paeniglutamicibacter cryotolerans]MBB2995183.1 DNA-binding MurR/RpiR family transcriptional regulator [Paeniglutamicibacter cryotolerans]
MSVATVSDLLRSKLGELTPAGREIAREILTDYPRAGLETAARLAARAGVSAPTVTRFAIFLGFEGYLEFQDQLRSELGERSKSALEQFPLDTPEPSSGAVQLAADAAVLAGQVSASLDAVPGALIEDAVQMLSTPGRSVHLLGGRFSHMVAQYLQTHLQLLRPGAFLVSSNELDRASTLRDMKRGDIVVAYDFRRYTPETVEFGKAARKRGAKIILVTDPWLSPLSTDASIVLPCSVASPSAFDALSPTMALTEVLISGLVRHSGAAGRASLSAVEAILSSNADHDVDIRYI